MLDLSHKKLEVWKNGVEFVAQIYRVTDKFPKTEIYGITNQLRRAAVSIPSNIAEGAARNSRPERRRFYEIARSSLAEIDTQLVIAVKLEYCSEEMIAPLAEKMNYLFALLSNLMKNT